MSSPARVVLKPKRARPFFGRHPWVFEQAIARTEGNPDHREPVSVYSHEGKFIGFGLFNERSKIRVRMLSWDESQPITPALIADRVRRAISFRRRVLGLDDPKGACRLVYSESDGLSGLIVDRYADVIVLQFTSRAMATYESTLIDTLLQELNPQAIVRRTERGVGELEGLETEDKVIAGSLAGSELAIELNGVRFLIDPLCGQKTGAYLDQRDNYVAVCQYVSGRSVFDVYCHGGGFGLTAMVLGKAASLLGVDVSSTAVEHARRNAELNGIAAEFQESDAVDAMQRLNKEGRRFGTVILDPPKFARTAAALDRALAAYERNHQVALDLLEPDGLLVTCNCSGLVTADAFTQTLVSAAQKSGREVRILETRGQSPDHPISAFCLETAYLTCLIAHVT